MPFITMPGVAGKVWVPDEQPGHLKKHNCKDCFSCQNCSDDRCQLCKGNAGECCLHSKGKKKRHEDI